ncbi:hypothetical protein H8R29_19205 [Priestia megaterium]|jgi:transcription initiation factor IIE alpha subunit|uniref:Uncharacterized protein n=2 Tax=Priestia megaterium TaxID=1404 RepID=A0A6M6DND9_PRIMG|nr:hypothetical protein [Priestia megaterium]AJI20565.1 hypothetical protein BG04_568 [Priestia megaterium NBRC 15308 = ATCC 14581]KFN06366.1 hypothetical protein DJ91_4427 [Priestia megaterium]KGJ81245.1 hypothetical protein BMT_18640 [Priestia megaterium NBRC 15308 = ATCC 14581]KLV29457.1 hypothetical protein ABW04_24340 [Priestia megaterium]MBU8753579.1 hypothetical protein [Priestia megaterium]
MNNIEKKKFEIINLKKQDEVNKNLIKVSESLVAVLNQFREEPDNKEVLAVMADLEGQKEQLKAKAKKLSEELAHL